MGKALIVDDSKTARYSLALLLRKLGFEVVLRASAEEGLDYLREQLPDVVFMDHLMPGMDGFQALKAIKAEPRTRALPIVMYTSRDGEVYFGQARALGAVDVLSKPARQGDVEAVLARVEERRQPVAVPPTPVVIEDQAELPASAPVLEGSEPPRPSGVQRDEAAAVPRGWPRAAAVTGLVALVLLALWQADRHRGLRAELSALQARHQQWYRVLEWGINESGSYPWGEPALSGPRLERVQQLVSQLHGLGFVGTVRLKVHVGDFCLVRGVDGSWLLAPPELQITDCEALGLPADEARQMGAHQGGSFHHFVEHSALLRDNQIRLEWQSLGSEQPRHDYPLQVGRLQADNWNRIAADNHRIEVELLPESAPAGVKRPRLPGL